jgi:hypothetical protein
MELHTIREAMMELQYGIEEELGFAAELLHRMCFCCNCCKHKAGTNSLNSSRGYIGIDQCMPVELPEVLWRPYSRFADVQSHMDLQQLEDKDEHMAKVRYRFASQPLCCHARS